MTNQTNEELREIEKSIEYFAQGYDVGCPYPSIEDIMGHIQSHTNKAIGDVLDRLNTNFITNLTIDSETTDARRKDFNQAIFDAEKGYQIFNGTDLGMVLNKFNKAIQQERNKLKESK